MKVAYLLGSLNRGGTETLMVDTLRQAVFQNQPCLLIHRKTGTLQSSFEQIGVPLRHLPLRSLLDFGYLFRLRKLLRSERAYVVHAQLALDGFLAYLACLGMGIRIVVSFHGYDGSFGMAGRLIIHFLLRRADLLLYVSHHLRRHYLKAFSVNTSLKKHQVLYNGIDFQKLKVSARAVIRKELGIPEKSLLLGMVGNFVEGRDHFTVCRFLHLLNAANVEFHMLFVGAMNPKMPGLYNDCLNYCIDNKLADCVHFLGSRSDVPSILSELDAFLYASDHDTFGIAVIEAMGAGVPVFVNDWAVMCEITNNGEHVTLYKTKDELDLFTKFNHFIANPIHYKQKAKEAKRFVERHYAIESHFQQLNRCYQIL